MQPRHLPTSSADSRLAGLDGLRAIALIAVFLFHAELTWARGGYLGVDLFFVISGFLITGLMVSGTPVHEHGELKRFYWRRAKRLLPAAWLMTIAMIVVARLLAIDALSDLRFDAVASFVYATNWALILHATSYFDAMGRQPLLLHLWSLAIEEQFYLVWAPIVLFGFRRLGRRGLAVVAAMLAAAAVVWMAILAARMGYPAQGDPSRLYFGTDTHAFSLLIGAILGLLWRPSPRGKPLGMVGKGAMTLLGLGALATTFFLFSTIGEETEWLYPWGLLTSALVSALLIFVATHRGTSFGRYLDNPVMRWIGERSYGMYLWHWPLFMLTRPRIDLRTLDANETLLIRIVLTVGISALSYRYLEQPIRQGALECVWQGLQDRARRRRAQASAVAMGVGLAAAFAIAGTILFQAPGASTPAADVRDALAVAPAASSTVALPPPVIPVTPVTPAEPLKPVEAPVVTTAPDQTDVESFAGRDLTAIGDSVLLGSSRLLRITLAGADVHATMGWQAATVLSELKAMSKANQLRPVVLVHLGTNGYVTEGQLREMLSLLASRKRVVLVNTHVPRRWMEPNDTLFDQVVPDYPNVVLVDWRKVSDGQPDYFVSDGVHLTPVGQRAFVAEIMRVGHLAPDASEKPHKESVDPTRSYGVGAGDLSDTLIRVPQSAALDTFWNKIARCETDNNWSTSGHYSGGLGISVGNWAAWGGSEFASTPAEATPAQQIEVANRISTQGWTGPDGVVVKPVGFASWRCVAAVGRPPASSPYAYTPESVLAQTFHLGERGDVVRDLELIVGLPRDGLYSARVRKRHLAYLKERGLSGSLAGSDLSAP